VLEAEADLKGPVVHCWRRCGGLGRLFGLADLGVDSLNL
jgi:hypothetical protein